MALVCKWPAFSLQLVMPRKPQGGRCHCKPFQDRDLTVFKIHPLFIENKSTVCQEPNANKTETKGKPSLENSVKYKGRNWKLTQKVSWVSVREVGREY